MLRIKFYWPPRLKLNAPYGYNNFGSDRAWATPAPQEAPARNRKPGSVETPILGNGASLPLLRTISEPAPAYIAIRFLSSTVMATDSAQASAQGAEALRSSASSYI